MLAKDDSMKTPNEPVGPPWGDDMEEAWMAQREWLEKHRASPPSVCSRRVGLFALVALVALVFARFLYTLLNGLFQG